MTMKPKTIQKKKLLPGDEFKAVIRINESKMAETKEEAAFLIEKIETKEKYIMKINYKITKI